MLPNSAPLPSTKVQLQISMKKIFSIAEYEVMQVQFQPVGMQTGTALKATRR